MMEQALGADRTADLLRASAEREPLVVVDLAIAAIAAIAATAATAATDAPIDLRDDRTSDAIATPVR